MLPNGVGQAFDNSKFELVRLVWTSYRWHSCWTADIGTIVNLHVDINNVLATTSLFSNQFLKIDCKARKISSRKNGVTVSVGETRSLLQGLVARLKNEMNPYQKLTRSWESSCLASKSSVRRSMFSFSKWRARIRIWFSWKKYFFRYMLPSRAC